MYQKSCLLYNSPSLDVLCRWSRWRYYILHIYFLNDSDIEIWLYCNAYVNYLFIFCFLLSCFVTWVYEIIVLFFKLCQVHTNQGQVHTNHGTFKTTSWYSRRSWEPWGGPRRRTPGRWQWEHGTHWGGPCLMPEMYVRWSELVSAVR